MHWNVSKVLLVVDLVGTVKCYSKRYRLVGSWYTLVPNREDELSSPSTKLTGECASLIECTNHTSVVYT